MACNSLLARQTELQDKHRLIAPNASVLDLGCAPGAWLQVACRSLGATGGRVLGVDLQTCSPGSLRYCDARVSALVADVLRLQPATLLAHVPAGFNVVLSDMAPSTTGASAVDGPRSAALSLAAARLALGEDGPGVLRHGGSLLVKLLEGPGGGREELQELCRGRFTRVLWARPKATRAESREVFLLGLQRTR
jgi:23S rRNA (uridine2552-2'-O)-methyltransferase